MRITDMSFYYKLIEKKDVRNIKNNIHIQVAYGFN